MRILEGDLPDSVVHATAEAEALSRVVVWHGGTPHTGGLLEPVVAAARATGRDVVSVARPGYGGAARRIGRSVVDVAHDVARILDLLDLDDVIVVGFSGGGPHAIATAAVRPRRVRQAVTFGCIAPFDATDDWFAGMADPTALRAAAVSLAARTTHPDAFEPSSFVDADHDVLDGAWRDLVADTQAAEQHGRGGAIDDDMAFTRPWGLSIADCTVPVIVVHGARDRVIPAAHARTLVAELPAATSVLEQQDGHVSILRCLESQLRRVDR